MFRYILQRSLTYLVMVFITTTMGYFAAVTALKPALLEQEKVPKPSLAGEPQLRIPGS